MAWDKDEWRREQAAKKAAWWIAQKQSIPSYKILLRLEEKADKLGRWAGIAGPSGRWVYVKGHDTTGRVYSTEADYPRQCDVVEYRRIGRRMAWEFIDAWMRQGWKAAAA